MNSCVGCHKLFVPLKFHPKQRWCSRECCDKHTLAERMKRWKESQKGRKWYQTNKVARRESRRLQAQRRRLDPLHLWKCRVRRYTQMYQEKYIRYTRGDACEACGIGAPRDLHHNVYRFPPEAKDITLLCSSCHQHWHKENEAKVINATVTAEVPLEIYEYG